MPQAGSPAPTRPYAALAPYFARVYPADGVAPWFHRALALAAAWGVRGGALLDVGAGTCRFSRFWARHGFRTVCLDRSLEMLRAARLGPEAGRLHRVAGTLDCLRDQPRFDVVTAIDDVVSYLGAEEGSLAPFLGRAARLLAPTGLLLFDFLTPEARTWYDLDATRAAGEETVRVRSRGAFDPASRLLEVTYEVTTRAGRSRERHRLRLFTPAEVEAGLRRAGFRTRLLTRLLGHPPGPAEPAYDVFASLEASPGKVDRLRRVLAASEAGA